MVAVNPTRQGRNGLEITYEALTNIAGGQLIVPQTGTTKTGNQGAQPAGDAALNCVGVAQKSALTFANQTTDTNLTTDGFPNVNLGAPEITTAAYVDVTIPVTYAAGAVAYGAKLACAAAGAVRAWVSGDGPAAIVGWCAQPGGAAGGGVALARINV